MVEVLHRAGGFACRTRYGSRRFVLRIRLRVSAVTSLSTSARFVGSTRFPRNHSERWFTIRGAFDLVSTRLDFTLDPSVFVLGHVPISHLTFAVPLSVLLTAAASAPLVWHLIWITVSSSVRSARSIASSGSNRSRFNVVSHWFSWIFLQRPVYRNQFQIIKQ